MYYKVGQALLQSETAFLLKSSARSITGGITGFHSVELRQKKWQNL